MKFNVLHYNHVYNKFEKLYKLAIKKNRNMNDLISGELEHCGELLELYNSRYKRNQ